MKTKDEIRAEIEYQLKRQAAYAQAAAICPKTDPAHEGRAIDAAAIAIVISALK